MIVWNEQRPDFCRKPIEDLVAGLTFTAACAVILGGGDRPKVIASQQVLDAIWAHLSEHRVETGGLLIGNVYSLDHIGGGFVVSVEDFARANHFDGTNVSLRMDTAVWEAARQRLTKSRSVIGWYHSHPDLGAFFSSTDRHTQNAFFNHPHCLGLVVDPIRRQEGWFIGKHSEELDRRQVLRVASNARPQIA